MDEQHDSHNHSHSDACDTGCCERLEAEGEVAVARLVMDGGELAHAANHVAGAVGTDPALPEAHEVLAELVARAGGPEAALELFPESARYAGALACRAALLAAVGRWDEAVLLVAMIMGAVPHLPWAHVAWLGDPELAARLDPASVSRAIVEVNNGLGEPADDAEKGLVEPFYALVRAVSVAHPADAQLLTWASTMARRLGDVDAAIDWARRAVENGQDELSVAVLGNALRRVGRLDEAIVLWAEAVERDPAQTYLAVDLAETYAQAGRPAEGVAVLERVLASEPDHEKAAPAVLGIRYEIDGDARHLLALADHYRSHPDHAYAAFLLEKFCRGVRWLGRLDTATEATTNVVRNFLKQEGAGTAASVSMSISMIEPPSAVLAARMVLPGLDVDFGSIGEPDPRLPVREVGVSVWRYEGQTAVPAVAPPSERALALVRDLAEVHWPSPPVLYDHGFALAGVAVEDLLGVLVHPPQPSESRWPDGVAAQAPDFWVRAVQTIACVGIAHHRPEQEWAESERRRILLDLLDGPEDWVCEAAGMALVAIGWTFPETREEIGREVMDRLAAFAKAAASRPVTVFGSMCRMALACPWLDAELTAIVRKRLAALEADDAAEMDRDEYERRVAEQKARLDARAGKAEGAGKGRKGRFFGRG